MRLWKLLLPLLASSLCLAQSNRITAPINSSQMVMLPGNVHPSALPQYDHGLVDPALPFSYVTLIIAPSPAQQAALDQLLAQQQDRSSLYFHKWLTPEQYAARFGLSADDANRITAWLESRGLAVLKVARGRNAVTFSGTAAQLQSAFKTEIHRYDVNGEEHIANSIPLSVPAALSGVVTSVRGLHDFRPKPMYVRPIRGGKDGPHPSYTTTFPGDTSPSYVLAPGDIATIYNLNPLYDLPTPIDGTGEKIAIVGQTDIYLDDLADFRSGFNLPSYTCTTGASGLITSCNTTNFMYVLLGSDPGAPSLGDLFESDLDVEWAGAVARNAQIIFINGETNGGVNDALNDAIENKVAPVVSMSYGDCELHAGSLEVELLQANSEGITVLNSSGDRGSAECDYNPPGSKPPFNAAVGGLAVSYPASSPEVTAVGGTSIPLSDYNSSFWNPGNATDGGSALPMLIGQEVQWNDDEALGAFCLANPGPLGSFCDPSPGVEVTNAQTFQEDYWISIGGGGVSNCYNPSLSSICKSGFARPTWQQSITIPGLTSPQSTYRLTPDVSLLASPNLPGYILCTPQEEVSNNHSSTSTCSPGGAGGISTAVDTYFSLVGGTSASAPVFAGIVALLNQYLGSDGLANINPTLYALAANPSNGAFHPVTSGDSDVYCQKNDPSGQPADVICPAAGIVGFSGSNADAATGYNLVTGLGSVDANALAVAWAASAAPDFQLSVSPTSVSVAAGASVSTTVTISPVTGSTGLVVNFSPGSCTGLPAHATCSFNPQMVNFDGTNSATTIVTISTLANMAPSGPTTITITPTNSSGTTTTVSLSVVSTTETFTLTTTASTFGVAVGGSVPVSITVNSTTGFINNSNNTTALPLTYTCTGSSAGGASLATAEISCQLPNSGQPSSATTVTFNLVTTAMTTQLLRPAPGPGRRIFYAMLLPGLFGIIFAAGSRGRAVRLLSLIVVLGSSTMWLGACGGSSSNNNSLKNAGTPPGQYTVTVNATTGGASPITNSTAFTLNVTQ